MRRRQGADQNDMHMGECLLRDGDMEDRAVVVMEDFARLTGRTFSHQICSVTMHRMPNETVPNQALGGADAGM